MNDANPQFKILNWLRQNGAVVSIAGAIVLLIAHAAVSQYQLSVLVAGQSVISMHLHDSARHIDPSRDAEATKTLKERIDKLEQRIERSERFRAWLERERESEAYSPARGNNANTKNK